MTDNPYLPPGSDAQHESSQFDFKELAGRVLGVLVVSFVGFIAVMLVLGLIFDVLLR